MGAILNANPVLHYSSAFLAGIGIKLLLDKFYISHAKRSIGFNWRYPPVTMSVLFGVFFIVSYVYVTYSNEILAQLTAHAFVSFKFLSLSFLAAAATIIYQTKLYTEKPIFSVALCAVSAFYLFSAICLVETEQAFWVFFCIAVAYLAMSVYLLCEQLKVSSAELIVESKEEPELTLESLKEFRKWFQDDSIIKQTEKLEPDLQVYANRITERLRNGGDKYEEYMAQHIALCGPFGCGKSSIVSAIANELKKSKKVEAELSGKEKLKVAQQNKITWIHSDISTWGAASGSVAHVILSHIIDDISQHLDMCAFRALPKHYTEALKSGGGLFQFASTLLAGPVDIEQSFQKLNDVLEVTNHKLLITLQDVDRPVAGDENEKRLNDIAALLDRLRNKDLSNINFIVAMGNDKPEDFEVISKATDYREDIAKIDFRKTLASFTRASIDEAKNKYSKIILYRYCPTHETNKLDQINVIIDSLRQLKKILRRVNQVWQSEKLMGEVNFYSLLMVIALRETSPTYFEQYRKADSYLESKIKSNEDDLDNVLREIAQLSKEDSGSSQSNIIKSEFIYSYLQVMLDVKKDSEGKLKLDPSKDHEQSVGCTHSDVDYLRRILLEKVPSNELKDQDVMKALRNGENKEKLNNYIHEAQYSLFESNALLCPKPMR
ncbi:MULTISPECIES: ATP-binding protein [unclassified Pseudoalteromonas]|uniref:ATP-binding protein n=1 Tax=unclassified Pseudoalteromonas TaxID=194690 RepID=UPI00110CE7AF|nr:MULTISPECIES: ATP-binding protein [unclassified Pseudoalteromonas]MDN3396714.1 ATP-binding protein [Pseudoalteromonas sp. APC 3215]MDN3472230.1 ATP-binding protein [Pseudoalteromonas sp. APC 4026]